MTAAAWENMKSDLNEALGLIEEYNRHYNTNFEPSDPWRLQPDKDGKCDYRDHEWPYNGKGGVYLILSENDEVLYVGEAQSLGFRFSQHFKKDDDGTGLARSPYWSTTPVAIVAMAAPDESKYERLSLEEYLIKKLQPVDNVRGK